jgi:RNA polymerase sigma-70 factor (ECF subfamily)
LAPSAGSRDWDWAAARAVCLREARRVLRDPYAAEDAAQEAVLRAWRSRDRCLTPHPGAWLRAIAANEALRAGERLTRTGSRESPADEQRLHEDSSELEDRLGAIACEQLLAPLGAADRHLMRLRYLEGLTQPQIASAVGIPEGTVKIRLHRSRKRVHTLLTNEALGGRN